MRRSGLPERRRARTRGRDRSQRLPRLPRRVGMLRAKEMMFTGRVVGGEEAAEIGLALECVPDDALEARIDALTSAMAENSWHTLRGD
ncbi:MAG: enoyl-CoA hydratase-related protein, partial [Acidobacteriota bacterium]